MYYKNSRNFFRFRKIIPVIFGSIQRNGFSETYLVFKVSAIFNLFQM